MFAVKEGAAGTKNTGRDDERQAFEQMNGR
jgi:hypothetical protein